MLRSIFPLGYFGNADVKIAHRYAMLRFVSEAVQFPRGASHSECPAFDEDKIGGEAALRGCACNRNKRGPKKQECFHFRLHLNQVWRASR
jgi:hypothetical protein